MGCRHMARQGDLGIFLSEEGGYFGDAACNRTRWNVDELRRVVRTKAGEIPAGTRGI